MPVLKLPILSPCSALRSDAQTAQTQGQGGYHDFEVVRVKGSHHFLRHADGRCTVVPVHAGEILGPGLLLQILRDTDLTKDDL